MALYLSNRDGDGKTDEEGHYKFPVNAFSGNVLNASDLVVTQSSPLALGVTVAPGQYRIPTINGAYAYTGWSDSSTDITISTADPANPRLTAIVIYIDKAEPTSASPPNNPGVAKFMAVNGTAAAVPTAPNDTTIQAAVGAGNPYIVLAHARVEAAGTTVSNAQITDQRLMVTVASNLVNSAALQDLSVLTAKINELAVTTSKLADKAATTSKMAPTYQVVNGNNGTSRQSFAATNTTYSIVGTSMNYTSGATAEILVLWGTSMVNLNAVGSQIYLAVNGIQVGRSVYAAHASVWLTCKNFAYYEIPANTAVTIDQRIRTAGTGTVCNSASDQSANPSFAVQTGMLAFGR